MMTMTRAGFISFLKIYALCFVVQGIGSYLTQQSVMDWYPTLSKSPLTPPGMWFGIVWTTLYVLMAIAATRVYRVRQRWNCRPLRWWLIQLLLGLVWSAVFFGHRNIGAGMEVIAINWLAIALTVLFFFRTDRVAGWLMVPLLLWVSFASYLNLFIWQHN